MSDAEEERPELSVPPGEIERALKKMRSDRDQAVQAEPTFKPSVILSNFVITLCAPIESVRAELEVLLTELALLVPSRFFIVSVADKDISQIESAVRVKEIKSSTGQEFYSEEIFIKTSRSTLPWVSSLIRGLCVSDVSIISYVMGEPLEGETSVIDGLLQHLRELCDLFLYDSREFGKYYDSVASLFALRRIIRPHNQAESRRLAPSSVRLRDLNWYRHERLRSLLAELYDASHLSAKSISSVEVILNQPKPNPTALILAGWLGEVLGKEDLIKIVPNAAAKLSPSFVKVIVKGSDLELSVSQDGDQFEVSTGTTSIRKLSSKSLSTAQLISLPVQSSGLDDYFTKSLERSLTVSQTWA